jgi:adenylate kinase family enzyme
MRVLVFGNSGSKKTTYARALALREDLAHLDLDSIDSQRSKHDYRGAYTFRIERNGKVVVVGTDVEHGEQIDPP